MDTSEKTLFVEGLPYSTTDTELEDTFSDYGPIKTCFTIKNKGTTDKCRGFGYVIYCTRDDAVKAMESVKSINGRKVQVSFATKRPTKTRKRKKTDIDDADDDVGEVSSKKLKLDAGGSHNDRDVCKTTTTTTTTMSTNCNRRHSRNSLTVSVRASTAVISGLPGGVTKKQIYKRCRKVGEVTSVTYPTDGRGSDTALVQYVNHQVATKAVSALNGKTFKGSTLSVVLLIQENKKISKKTIRRARLIVRNLKFECSEDTLQQIFSKFGKVIEMQIPTKKDGKRIGCAFVQYSSVFDASRAIKNMNGEEIQGRAVAVDWVVPKTKYEEAKLAGGVQVSSPGNNDEVKSSCATDKQQLPQLDSDEEGTASDSMSSEDEITECTESVGGEEAISVHSDDEEQEVSITEHKARTPHHRKKYTNDVSEGRTVFIRNLSFDTDEDDLNDMFSEFGNISYCKIVVNPQTGMSKGTGFIQFKSHEAAQSCIAAAIRSDGKGLFLDGRQLNVTLAISREEATKIRIDDEKRKVDKRNLYLAKEGTIDLQSEESKKLSKSELVKRQRAASEKKAKLGNPNYFISKTRLSIRNLAATVSEKQLKDVLLKYVKGTPAQIKQVKILRSKDRISSEGIGRSMGYGFVEFTTHEAALSAVRAISNNPSVFGPHKMPIVEFALENAQAINLRKERLKRRQVQMKLKGSPTLSTTPQQVKKLSKVKQDTITLAAKQKDYKFAKKKTKQP